MASELGDFLRARRTDAALDPRPKSDVGRRRISGLRREEVAAAAGISVDYYVRLEQGRELRPSDAVIHALARELHLSDDERRHVFQLRDATSAPPRDEHTGDVELSARMTALVDAVSLRPAYVLDRVSNMVAANVEGLALYRGFADKEPGERNTCRYLMTDARARETFVEWEDLARGAVAHLRAANATDLHDTELQALVVELSAASPLFSGWWAEHLVQRRRAAITHVRTDAGEVVAWRYEVLHLPDEGLRMTLWLPAAAR